MARRFAGWTVLLLGLGAYFALQVWPLARSGGEASQQNDFKHIYLGAMLLSQGQNPYDDRLLLDTAHTFEAEDPRFHTILPYVYLPFTGMVLWPLTLLTFKHAALAWMLINHGLVLGGLWLAGRAAGERPLPCVAGLALVALAFFHPLFRQTNAGQLNGVLMFGYALLMLGVSRGWKPSGLGAIAAFLALFKLSPALLFFWFLLERRWREAAWMAAFGAAGMALAAARYGVRVHLDFLPLLRQMGMGHSTWAGHGQAFFRDPYNISFNSLFHRTGLSATVANGLTYQCALFVALAFALLAPRRRSVRAGAQPALLSLSAAILCSLLLPSLCWDHYLVQTLPVFVVLGATLWEGSRAALIVGTACYAAMALNVELGSGTLRSFTLGRELLHLPAGLVASAVGQCILSFKTFALLALFALTLRRTSSLPPPAA